VVVKDVAQFFKVLADEARLKMLWLLFNHQELCVCDIMAALDITQSKASRHLATLRHAGLVVDRREAAWSHYSIGPVKNELERSQLEALRKRLADHPDAARILADLRAWLRRKDFNTVCAAECARRPATDKRAAHRTRAPLSGGHR
jgi:ArsR family transcriptional regulator, arsenate/arsenite/antimonite-responsive transcriptional repressor